MESSAISEGFRISALKSIYFNFSTSISGNVIFMQLRIFFLRCVNIDFTTFLMKLINYNFDVYALKKAIDWYEFDTKQDFENYENILKK